MNDRFAAAGDFAVRRRWWIIGFWVLVTVALGATLAPHTSQVLRGGGYAAPSSQSVSADHLLDSEFHQSAINNLTVVFHSEELTVGDAVYRDQVLRVSDRLRALDTVSTVSDYYASGNPALAAADGHTAMTVVTVRGNASQVQEAIPSIRDQLRDLSLLHWVTGQPAIDYDLIVQSEKDLQYSELITIPVILLLLLVVFRTVISALTPLILGATSISLATSLVFLLGTLTSTSVFALNVGTMLGLGLSIDYALFLVSRYRDERAAGLEPRAAIPATMATAGRSIAYSGITVMLAMGALAALTWDIGIVRSIALAVLLVAGAALVAAMTLVPALLAALGDRIEWLRVLPRPRPRPTGEGFWYRFSQAVMHRPWVWLVAGVMVLAVLALPVRDIRLGPSGTSTHNESGDGYAAIQAAYGGGGAAPISVLVEAHGANGVWTPEFLAALRKLNDQIKTDGRVQDATSLSTVFASLPADKYLALDEAAFRASPAARLPLVNAQGASDVAVISVVSRYDWTDDRTETLVEDLRRIAPAALPAPYEALVGGTTATFVDFRDLLNARFPLIVATMMLMIFVILLLFFRSVVLPIKAMILNLASVLATFGALVAVFQYGWGADLLGFRSFHAVAGLTPTVLYVIIFGLSTDYEVLMLSRVKEHYLRSRNNQESVAEGLQRTAGVITAAALILVGTFASFATGGVMAVKEIGLGLAFGVLLDATLVRVVLVPATMRLMGDANWWLPRWLDRVLPKVSEGEMRAPAPIPPGPVAPAQIPPGPVAPAPAVVAASAPPQVDGELPADPA